MITQEERNSELYHYGVLGMKWGKRKARSYARDVNRHRYNQTVDQAKRQKSSGSINRDQYRKARFNAKKKLKSDNAKVDERLSKVKVDRDKSVTDIYQKDKRQAYSEISNYAIKRGFRATSKALIAIGAIGAAYTTSGVAVMDHVFLSAGAKKVAIDTTKAAISTLAPVTVAGLVRKKITNATM